MDEERLRALWSRTVPQQEGAESDPSATFRTSWPEDDAARGDDVPPEEAAFPTLELSLAPPLRAGSGEGAAALEPTVPEPSPVSATDATVAQPPPASATDATIAEPPPRAATDATIAEPPPDPAATRPLAGAPPAGASAPTVALPGGASPGEATVDLGAGEAGETDARRATRLAGFELLEQIGKGGMGVVYRARQTGLQREVAVKRMLAAQARARGLREKFIAEALVTGVLSHPNIVPVHELGRTPHGEVMLAMKLVGGRSWKDELQPPPPDAEKHRHVEILLAVCNAVAFAHSKGIAHLDLKPENVMLGEFGEVLVMDWGLAVSFADAPDARVALPRTRIDGPMGTPRYMPPELAEGRGADVGPWTDVYLLGAILYEISTGSPPHRGGTLMEVITAASVSAPPDWSSEPEAPAEVRAICARAMAREPKDRYQTVAELQADLRAFLTHRESRQIARAARKTLARAEERARGCAAGEIAADGPTAERSQLYADFSEAIAGFRQARTLWAENPIAIEGESEARLQFARTALRNGDLALAEAQLDCEVEPGAQAAFGAVRGEVSLARAARERERRNARRLKTTLAVGLALFVVGLTGSLLIVRSERDRTRRRFAESLLAQADALGGAGRWDEATRLLLEARDVLGVLGAPQHPAVLGLWQVHRNAPPPLLVMRTGAGATVGVAWLPGGDAAIAVDAGAGDAPATVRRWNVVTGIDEPPFGTHERSDGAVAVSPDGTRAASADDVSGVVTLWDLEARARLAELEGHAGAVGAIAFSPDGRRIATAGHDGTVRLWDARTGAPSPAPFATFAEAVEALAWSPDGTRLVAGGIDRELTLLDVATAAVVRVFEGHGGKVTDAAFTPDGARLVSSAFDGSVRVWSVATGETVADLAAHEQPALAVAVSSDGRLAATGGWDGRILVWDLAAARVVRTLAGHADWVHDLAYSPSHPGLLLSAGGDGALVLWDTGPTPEVRDLIAPGGAGVSALGFSPDGLSALAGLEDGRAVLLDVATGIVLRTYDGVDGEAITGAAIASDHRRVVTASRGGAVVVRDAKSGDVLRRIGDLGAIYALALAPDGGRIAVGGRDAKIRILDAGSGETLATLEGHERDVNALAFAPDGRRLLSGSGDFTVRLWDPATGRGLGTIARHESYVTAVAFAPDGRSAISGGWDEKARLFGVPGGDAVTTLAGHREWLTAVGIDPDGRIAMTASGDQTVRLWDVGSGAELRVLRRHQSRVQAAGFAPVGLLAISGAQDGRVTAWDFARAGRYLTLMPRVDDARAALRARPEAIGPLERLAEWYVFRGCWKWAIALMKRCREGGWEPPALDFARAHLRRGEVEQARAELERARARGEAPAAYIDLLLD